MCEAVGWKRKQMGRWKRCWMEEETDGTVEEVLGGRGNGWDGGRAVGWKMKQMGRWERCWMEEETDGTVEEVLDERGNSGMVE